MKTIRPKVLIAIFPVIAVIAGIYMLQLFDPFYSKSADPEFPYLVNGLNCAQLHFNWIGHFDHPGTPYQVYNGIIIWLTHLFSGKNDIATDVFSRPEHYLNAISISMFLIQAFLIYLIGSIGLQRKIPVWQLFFLQAAFLFSDVLLWLLCRANPDRFFLLTGSLFFMIYLKHGYENRSPIKFALWSGTAMAFGLATKFNFLPLLFLPLLFITTNKNRLIYAASGIVSFFIFILPIIDKLKQYRIFVMSIFKHDGLYGGGESKVLNVQKMIAGTKEIFTLNPELLILTIALFALLIFAVIKRKTTGAKYTFWFAGFLVIIALQIVMVSKHFKNYYLAPTFMIYGFIFFISSMFLKENFRNKKSVILYSSILPVIFVMITLGKSNSGLTGIKSQIAQREKIMNFVNSTVTKDDIWFVEPTWEGGPFQENAIIYGLSYCGHRDQYLNTLMAINPNIITYEGNPNEVKFWRCGPARLDSVVASRKNIYLYSTPGRNAPILLDMLQKAGAERNLLTRVDTVYSDSETKNEILKVTTEEMSEEMKLSNRNNSLDEREKKIQGYIQSIKDNPEWLENVRKKALDKKISLDSMILLDAIYMVDTQK